MNDCESFSMRDNWKEELEAWCRRIFGQRCCLYGCDCSSSFGIAWVVHLLKTSQDLGKYRNVLLAQITSSYCASDLDVFDSPGSETSIDRHNIMLAHGPLVLRRTNLRCFSTHCGSAKPLIIRLLHHEYHGVESRYCGFSKPHFRYRDRRCFVFGLEDNVTLALRKVIGRGPCDLPQIPYISSPIFPSTWHDNFHI